MLKGRVNFAFTLEEGAKVEIITTEEGFPGIKVGGEIYVPTVTLDRRTTGSGGVMFVPVPIDDTMEKIGISDVFIDGTTLIEE